LDRAERSAIRCRGLVKRFPDVIAVAGVDLEVRSGECFGLLGPNGAGKTTMVEMLEGLLAPDAGSIEVLGQDGARPSRALRQRLGIQLQQAQLFDKLTVLETLELFRSFYDRGIEPQRALGLVRLEEKARSRVGKLSGGQRQRLSLACTLVCEPEILFLDEPTTGLDPQSRLQVWEIIGEFRRRGGTVLLTTHYMDEAARLCDRVAILDRGRVLAVDTVPGLLAAHGGRPTLVLEDGEGEGGGERRIETEDPLAELNRRAREGPLRGFRVERPDLEQVFLKLTGHQLRD
jgi:ABC-2 type transport system ATP-binding protein